MVESDFCRRAFHPGHRFLHGPATLRYTVAHNCLSVSLAAGILVTCALLRLCVVCRWQKLVAMVPTRKLVARFTRCCTMDCIFRMFWRQLLARPIVSTCAKGCSLTWLGGCSQRRTASCPTVSAVYTKYVWYVLT